MTEPKEQLTRPNKIEEFYPGLKQLLTGETLEKLNQVLKEVGPGFGELEKESNESLFKMVDTAIHREVINAMLEHFGSEAENKYFKFLEGFLLNKDLLDEDKIESIKSGFDQDFTSLLKDRAEQAVNEIITYVQSPQADPKQDAAHD